MQARGVGAVYKIYKSSFVDLTYTKYLGTIHMLLPSSTLAEEYEAMRAEYQDALYEKLRKGEERRTALEDRKIEEDLHPQGTYEQILEKARLILPQIVNPNKDTDQGLIDMMEIRRLLNLPHNKAYSVRKALLQELHAEDDKLLKELREKVQG